jgi:hypothetical protein
MGILRRLLHEELREGETGHDSHYKLRQGENLENQFSEQKNQEMKRQI